MQRHISEPDIALRIDGDAVRHVEAIRAPRMSSLARLRIQHDDRVVADRTLLARNIAVVRRE